ncbi:hypothetical protein F6V25_15385 [Oryzomonas japonica]|uniref:DUF4124 domain-containing protein n=1 Tax=Oryzomonas japonica TaxID=2603858 RepID=A0A7J4ZMA7_9BACT|nr:hypothetical protein [Oryzomonas japonica]KAB0663812.1 hypothetical protein F6V25_15385 [Oryzomonas japonica]
MKRALILPLLFLCNTAAADGGTYTWVDGQEEDVTSRDPKVLQELREEVEKPHQDECTLPRVVTTAESEQAPGRQQEIKGHLGGDQTDPTPPSMKQPASLPPDEQPKETPAGMKQPKPLPLGDQPKGTPAGMKQPKPLPLDDQPKTMPAGMEQPAAVK